MTKDKAAKSLLSAITELRAAKPVRCLLCRLPEDVRTELASLRTGETPATYTEIARALEIAQAVKVSPDTVAKHLTEHAA